MDEGALFLLLIVVALDREDDAMRCDAIAAYMLLCCFFSVFFAVLPLLPAFSGVVTGNMHMLLIVKEEKWHRA